MKKGDRYNRLVAVRFSHRDKWRAHFWVFRCDCGKRTTVSTKKVRYGKTKSCGCFRRSTARLQGFNNKKHGMTQSLEWRSWRAMRKRCYDNSRADYHRYGGRGIKICPEWDDFAQFLKDVGPRPSSAHTLGRIDNDGDYEPTNCRWETQKQQARNRRSSTYIETSKGRMLLIEASELSGIRVDTLWRRIRRGWSPDALFMPKYSREKR